MPFRLIKNKTQDIAVKGFIATAVLCAALAIFKVLPIDMSAPFVLVWAMIWIIGASMNSKSSS
ncbi:MAG TPA: hypothetical protein VK808_10935 [Bacteroidia bacterium]|jgi:hypothetical protein|nr:hypothetical protein [Bacteroidia bacterium]